MINSITFKFGRAPGSQNESTTATPVTVFVGPNNSGKSKVLAEIYRFCTTGQRSATDVILEGLDFAPFSITEGEKLVDLVTRRPRANESIHPEHILVGKKNARVQVQKDLLVGALANPNVYANRFCQWYLAYNTLKLDGPSRISLINEQPAGDLQAPPHTSLQVLFRDDIRRAEVRRIIYDAFGSYFVIDPSHLSHLRIRLSSRAPVDGMEERGIHDEAIRFHAEAMPIEEASDGVKAFTGMITEIVAGDPAVLLIDEPEAFLHPSLSFQLGNEISRASSGSQKRLFVSTHSPNFVMGCIQSGAPVNLIRLTYRDGVATARILPSGDILKLMRNPLLRSTSVLSGLFHEFVVVTEADTDRAFYQEINERLLRFHSDSGVPNCLFLNAQNKQTVQTIIRPLRELGIPAAAIVDIDIVKEGGTVWSGFLEAGFVPEIDRQSMATLRAAVKQRFDSTGKDMKRDGGIDLLRPNDKEAASNLFDRLAEYGLFVVRRGEIEQWLSGLGARGHGPNWLVDVFEKMGEDPSTPSYVKPGADDVWSFMETLKRWLVNPKRKGIP